MEWYEKPYSPEDYLEHYGVLGMKWGQHKAKREEKREKRRIAKEEKSISKKIKKLEKASKKQAIKDYNRKVNEEANKIWMKQKFPDMESAHLAAKMVVGNKMSVKEATKKANRARAASIVTLYELHNS